MSLYATITFRLASGEFVGPVNMQGNAGAIQNARGSRERVEGIIARANRGDYLGVYEPRIGHVCVYTRTASEDLNVRHIDLRGAEIVGWE